MHIHVPALDRHLITLCMLGIERDVFNRLRFILKFYALKLIWRVPNSFDSDRVRYFVGSGLGLICSQTYCCQQPTLHVGILN